MRAIALGGIEPVKDPDPADGGRPVRRNRKRKDSSGLYVYGGQTALIGAWPNFSPTIGTGVVTASSVGSSGYWYSTPAPASATWAPLVQSPLRQRVAAAKDAALAAGLTPTTVWLGLHELAELDEILQHDIPCTAGYSTSSMNINLVGLRVMRDRSVVSRLDVE